MSDYYIKAISEGTPKKKKNHKKMKKRKKRKKDPEFQTHFRKQIDVNIEINE